MSDIEILIRNLGSTPVILQEFLAGVPEERLKVQRIPGKWSIHKHVCHLAETEQMLLERFQRFAVETHPVFEPYLPGANVKTDHLLDLNLAEQFGKFTTLRKEMATLLGNFTQDIWSRTATHPEYEQYGSYILLRHVLLHDHLHLYRMEELWITRDAYLRKP